MELLYQVHLLFFFFAYCMWLRLLFCHHLEMKMSFDYWVMTYLTATRLTLCNSQGLKNKTNEKLYLSFLYNRIQHPHIHPLKCKTFNAMMTVFINNNLEQSALKLYDQYDNLNDDTSHMLAIKACIDTNNMIKVLD